LKTFLSAIVIGAGVLTATSTLADKPDFAGNGKGSKHEKQDKREKRHDENRRSDRDDDRRDHNHSDRDRGPISIDFHFGERQRTTIRDYYVEEHSHGRCPPGLAKKRNGCMPPGLAKKWKKGHSLPRDVTYYDLPPQLVIKLGTPPSGHRYVRVASDILLIAVGTGMVIDAIEDLSGM
jgi:Ni/Co efflux regulator RcnB